MDKRVSQPVRTLVFDECDSKAKLETDVSAASETQIKTKQDVAVTEAAKVDKCTNLQRMRRSALGKSAPSLSAHMKEMCVSRRPSRLPNLPPHHRLSLVVNRCASPIAGPLSPAEAPRASPLHHALLSSSLKRNKEIDGRRWSVASLPSSGYGTTPGSSSLSSQCSSQERLLVAHDLKTSCPHCTAHRSSTLTQPQSKQVKSNVSPRRPRSRSLSERASPSRSPASVTSDEDAVTAMSALFSARFPAATKAMNDKLKALIEELSELEKKTDREPIERFVHHQILEMARDCLHKSESKQVTSSYFYDMSESLERLLAETNEKSVEAANGAAPLVSRLTLAMARPARLLECLEFDPATFYRLLEAAEGHAKNYQGVTAELPQYIIHKLGLSRDPLADIDGPLSEGTPTHTRTTSRNSTCNQSVASESTPPSEHDYQVVKLISNGAYGAVYLVKHKQTRQRYAMKKISKNNLILRNQVDQAFAERDILSFADNPFVVSMYCSFETRRHVCLVLELVEGGDCASLLRGGPLPPDMARHYFAEAVLAVEYLHSYGIVHRDLKPDNLLITATGHIKLTDFGLSKMGLMSLATNLYEEYADREARQFSDKQVCGTPEYIAPEVILRQGYGKPVDWWSMGIILYEFLIGCVPFFGDTPEELFAHTVNDDIEWPSEEDFPIAVEAKAIITELLARNPRDRLGTVGTHQVKDHVYFHGLDWNNLLRRKAEFIPQLENEEDTSYFDSRCDRYNHSELESEDAGTGGTGSATAGVEEMFPGFCSTSPQYRRQLSDHYHSKSTDSWPGTPGTPDSTGPLPLSNIAKPTMLASTSSAADSSQTDSDSVSPGTKRRPPPPPAPVSTPLTPAAPPLPATTIQATLLSEDHKKDDFSFKWDKSNKNLLAAPSRNNIRRSASTSGLSLIIHPPEEYGNTSSTNSSRDSSPCRDAPEPFQFDNNSLIQASKPPIVIRRGPRGFGFTIHTVRVYYGDSDYYTMHHLVSAVSEQGAAWAAGLRAGDLITQLNGEFVAGLLHTQVIRLLLGAGTATIRAAPLELTSIRPDGRRRRHAGRRAPHPAPRAPRRRRASLFRRISSRRAEQEMHQMASDSPASPSSPASDGPSITTHFQRPRSLHGLKHKLVTSTAEGRRPSLSHMPLSPLARTPSPGPPASPTSGCGGRSPSPLAGRGGSAGGGGSSVSGGEGGRRRARASPASPLLRRALSPDRLHPRSAEVKCSLSPLCCVTSGSGSNVVSTSSSGGSRWRPPAPLTVAAAPSPPLPEQQATLPITLPRITEEKDSPTHHSKCIVAATPPRSSNPPPNMYTSSPLNDSINQSAVTNLDSTIDTSLDESMSIPHFDTTGDMSLLTSRANSEPSNSSSTKDTSREDVVMKSPEPVTETASKISRGNTSRKSGKKKDDPAEPKLSGKNEKVAKRSDSRKELKRQNSSETRKSADNLDVQGTVTTPSKSGGSVVSKLLSAMGRTRSIQEDVQGRHHKHNKRKANTTQQTPTPTKNDASSSASAENNQQQPPSQPGQTTTKNKKKTRNSSSDQEK